MGAVTGVVKEVVGVHQRELEDKLLNGRVIPTIGGQAPRAQKCFDSAFASPEGLPALLNIGVTHELGREGSAGIVHFNNLLARLLF